MDQRIMKQSEEWQKNQQSGELIFDMLSFDQIKDYFNGLYNINIDDVVKRLNIVNEQHEQRRKKWDQFINKSQQIVNPNGKHRMTSLETLFGLKQECRNIYDERQICNEFQQWKRDKSSLASILDELQQITEIPEGGLSNVDLERILSIYQKYFKGFKTYYIATNDLIGCNVIQRFNGQGTLPSNKQIKEVMNNIIRNQTTQHINKSNAHKFGQITKEKLQKFKQKGIDIITTIINTGGCKDKGMHWIVVIVNIKTNQVILFNSVGEYEKELQVVRIYCKDLQQMLQEVNKQPVKLLYLEDEVQTALNTCGVFCLMFITCQLLDIDYKILMDKLKKDKQENLINLFKRMFFG